MNYKELFSNHLVVKQFATVQLIAYFGAWFSNVAIYSMLVDFGAGAFVISLVAAMHLLPGAILAPFSGTIVDRVEAKRLMLSLMSIELVMTLCFLTINSINDVWLLLILLFIRMGSASIFFTTQMSYLPKLLSNEALIKANELHSIIWSFTFTAGMAAGGIVVSIFGAKISFIIDGLFFLTAILILMRIEFTIKIEKATIKIWQSIKDGILYLKEHKYLWHYFFLHASVGFTAFDAIVTLLADYHYKYIIAVPLAIGLTNSIRAFALMIGPIFTKKFASKDKFHYLFIFQGLAIIIWANIQDNFYLGLFGMFLTGIATTTIWSYTYAMLQNKVDKNYLGRVLAYNEMIFMSTNVIVTLFIGLMASLITLDIISTILGLAFIAYAYYYKRVFL